MTRPPGTFASLANRPFRIVWLGTLFAFLAFFMSTVVQSVVAFDLVGNNTAVGSVVLAQGLSMTVLGLIGGALADRWPKRRTVMLCQLTVAAVFAALAVLVASPHLALAHLMTGSLLIGATFALLGPARQALVVELVPETLRGNAVALTQVANTASRVGGPFVAGLMLEWSRAGAPGAYALMALSYLGSALALTRIAPSPAPSAPARPLLGEAVDGFRYVARDPRLRLMVASFVGVIMFGFPHVTVLPGFMVNALGRDPAEVTLLFLASAVGALAASLVVARFADSPRAPGLFVVFGAGFGLALALLAVARSFSAAAAAMLAVGVGSGGFQALNGALLVRAAEPRYIGRVMAVTLLAFGAFGLMGWPVGKLADAVGERGALFAEAGAVLAIVAGFGLPLLRVPEG